MAAVPSIGRASLVEAPRVAPQAALTQGLYERHAAKIQSYCQHQLGSREEAEDAVQTTFMNAFRALGRGVVPEAESAWLFKIAENVCLSRRRSSWRRGRIESPSDFGLIEEIVPGPSRQRDELIGIEDALASMPEQQRRAILLREWQGLSYREIATELEVSQSAVETLIFRARRSLAQGLEQPDSIKPAKRKSFRRAMHMIDFGTIAAAVKTLVAGSAAVKATAAAVAVTAVIGTAATVTPKLEGHSPAQAPPKALVAPAPAPVDSSASSTSTFSSSSSSVGTVESAPKPIAIAAPRAAKQKPARGAGSRSAPALVVPVAAAPAPSTPFAAEPEASAVEPVQPAQSAPVQQTPAPAAEQAKHEQKHEATPPAAEPAKRTDEGKKDEGKHKGRGAETPAPAVVEPTAPVASAPVVSTPRERRGGNSKGRGNDDKGKDAPITEALAPASVPAFAEEAKNQGSKKERGRGNEKQRELTSAPSPSPVPTPVVAAPEQAPAAAPIVATTPQPAPVAESSRGSSDGHGKRKGK